MGRAADHGKFRGRRGKLAATARISSAGPGLRFGRPVPKGSPHSGTVLASGHLTALSVFTGAGGLDLGLHCAGFDIVGCVDLDLHARQTIRANRPTCRFLEPHDITQLATLFEPKTLSIRRGDLDVLAAGPPCQPFSKAAQWATNGKRGLSDPRAKCLAAFLRLVEKCLPRVVLMENVPGFIRGESSALPVLSRAFDRINRRHGTHYNVDHRELDSVDYGVPQRRRRVIVIARRDGKAFDWPSPTHSHRPVRAYDALVGLRVRRAPPASGKWAALLPSIPEGQNYL